jgi:hypothetical protein
MKLLTLLYFIYRPKLGVDMHISSKGYCRTEFSYLSAVAMKDKENSEAMLGKLGETKQNLIHCNFVNNYF